MKCRKTTRLLFLGLILAGSLVLPAFGQEAGDSLTNDDVVRMAEAGLPPAVIVAKIQSSRTDFDTSVDALLALSAAEVAPEILEAMAGAGAPAAPAVPVAAPVAAPLPAVQSLEVVTGERASAVANVATNFEGTPCEYPGIYLSDGESLVDLEITRPSATKTGSAILSALTYGVKSTKAKALVRGVRSPVRTNVKSPTFYFCFEEAQGGLSYQTSGAVNPAEFLLIAFDVIPKKQQRSFILGKLNAFTGGSGGTPPKQMRQVEYKKVVPGVYEVKSETLAAGEYAFYYSGQASIVGRFGGPLGGAFGGQLGGGAEAGAGGTSKLFAFGVD